MSNKKILFQKLDDILGKMVEYSFTLGDLGEYIRVEMYLVNNGYNGKSFTIKQSEKKRYDSLESFNSRFLDIYHSKYNYITNSYNIDFNSSIRNSWESDIELENIILNIETLAINIYNIVVNSYLDPSKEYKKISISFKRNGTNYNKIIEEIEESIIFGQSIDDKYEFIDQPVFKLITLKEKKNDLSYPDYYRFNFIVYELSKFLNFF